MRTWVEARAATEEGSVAEAATAEAAEAAAAWEPARQVSFSNAARFFSPWVRVRVRVRVRVG